LTTRVREPDKDDWKKLLRLMTYLQKTQDLVVTLETDNYNKLLWYADAAYSTHLDMKGHAGGMLTLGKGAVYGKSSKQKLNTKSSTECELVGTDDLLPQIIWTNNFIKDQGWECNQTVLRQDNKSTILLENNGRLLSSNRTKHINIRYFYIKDVIDRGELEIEYCNTDDMIADYFSKPLQGEKFRKFRREIMNLE